MDLCGTCELFPAEIDARLGPDKAVLRPIGQCDRLPPCRMDIGPGDQLPILVSRGLEPCPFDQQLAGMFVQHAVAGTLHDGAGGYPAGCADGKLCGNHAIHAELIGFGQVVFNGEPGLGRDWLWRTGECRRRSNRRTQDQGADCCPCVHYSPPDGFPVGDQGMIRAYLQVRASRSRLVRPLATWSDAPPERGAHCHGGSGGIDRSAVPFGADSIA